VLFRSLLIVDQGGSGLRFPGDLKRVGPPAAMKWVAVYQRSDDGIPTVFAREARVLPGPFGPETRVSDPAEGAAYDPGVVQVPGGEVLVTWHGAARAFSAPRTGPAAYGLPRELFSDPGGTVQELTVATVGGTAFVAYCFRPASRVQAFWDVRVRVLGPGPSVAPPIVVTVNGPGPGSEGVQKRVTIASTGTGRGLIAVWNEHAAFPDGPRTIDAAFSSDGGTSWTPGGRVADFPGHDLVNPFAVSFGPHDLRIYFTQHGHVPPLGEVRSTDGGRTWGSRRDVPMPAGASAARIVIASEPGAGAFAFVATKGFTELGTFLLAG